MNNDSLEVWGLAAPVVSMCAVALLLALTAGYQATVRRRYPSRRPGFFPSAALGCAFLAFATMYRPSLALLAKAQIRQQEDADDEDSGGPDTPTRHLHRQLRRIRRGQRVERLIVRTR